MSTETSVRVCVRVRPLIPKERLEDEHLAVETFDNQIKVASQTFTFDHVFGTESGQEDIWPCVTPLVDSVFEGYNATIFAYGQTGSGKTFTMGSGNSAFVSNPDERGIIPRVLQEMFGRIEAKKAAGNGYRVELRLRFLEIYGEEIRDLLSQFGNGTLDTSSKVNLKEVQNGQVQVQGAREEEVNSAEECISLLDKGTFCRTVGATEMNSESSRSHAILTLTMVQYIPYDMPSTEEGGEADAPTEFDVRCCYFNFVDLAGSEKQKMTKAEGQRLKEGIDINKGLFVLGCVINALGDDTKRGKVHVPYRDSKLTRMLQDSLGGNSRTLMVCCVSPAGKNIAETKSSLSYANRARNIQNKAVVNRDEQSSLVADLRRQIQALEGELFAFRHPGADMNDPKIQAVVASSDWRLDSFSSLRSRTEGAEAEVMRLSGELKRWRNEMDAMKEELLATQAQRDYFRLCCEELKGRAGGGPSPVGPEGEEMGVIQEQLRTIQNLQERLRVVESERDKAHIYRASSGTLDFSAFEMSADAIQEEQRLIEQAEQEIKRESELLKQLQAMENSSLPPPAPTSVKTEETLNPDEDEPMGEDTGTESMDESVDASSEMVAMQREFQQRQQVLGASVQDLSTNISLKEHMLQTLRKNAEGYERMRGMFEAHVAEMAEKERSFLAERERLLSEMQKIQNQATDPRYQKLSYDLQNKDGELGALRKKQAEMKRFESLKAKSDVQLRVLTNEITAMKKQKVDLLKKMQSERKKYEQEASERKREIINLKRAHQRDRQQILKLGSEKDAQERVLKRRMEEVAAANRRLKQQQLLIQANAKEKKKTPQKKYKSKDEEWLAEQIQKLADKQKKAELLEKELDKREKIVQQMERLHGMRAKLQNELKASMEERNGSNIRDILISPFKQKPEGQQSPVQGLSKDEEAMLAELEERIEACQAQLEYKNERISEMTSSNDTDEQGEAMVKVENSSLPEARTLLKLLFNMAVDVRNQEQTKEAELERSALQVQELEKHLRMEKERNHVMRETYEEKLQKMIADAMNEPEDPTSKNRLVASAVEERNHLLRKKCEELESQQLDWQRQSQQLIERNAKYQQGLATCRERIKWLENQLNASKRGETVPADDLEDMHLMDDDFAETMSVGSASSESNFPTNTQGGATAEGGSSIFNRLSNPNNFTGIHRHRLQENAMQKREEIKNKSQPLRTRRLKDRNIQSASKLRQPNSSVLSPRGRASTPRPRTTSEDFITHQRHGSAVMDVLAIMKKEKEMDGQDDYDMEEDQSDTMSEGGYGMESPRYRGKKDMDTMSEGSPRSARASKKDVFSRLNGQYTASAQYKRQSYVGNEKGSVSRARDAVRDKHNVSPTMDEHGVARLSNAPLSAPATSPETTVDPMTGRERFVVQVMDDLRKKTDDAR
ncbi:Kinesin-like protein kif21b [Aphanomyces cochlioides]|nr:Kinesin-like protein kif21b [Aphanomyces cochlioides]